MAVRGKRHFPITVGPKDLGPRSPVAIRHLWDRMPEVIRSPGADDGDLGIQCGNELGGARCQAAVVGHLHDAQSRSRNVRRDLSLYCPADVTGQQHRHVAPAELEDERVVVPNFLPLPVGRLRVMRNHLDVVDHRAAAGVDVGPPRPARLDRHAQHRQRLEARHRNPLPHLPRSEFLD